MPCWWCCSCSLWICSRIFRASWMAFITVSWSPNNAVEFKLDRISVHTQCGQWIYCDGTPAGTKAANFLHKSDFFLIFSQYVSVHFGTRLYLFVCLFMSEVALLPRDELRPRPPPSGLGIPPLLGRRLGLFLLPRNRFCVGDVGDLTISVVFGRADRLSGCVPSSYGSRQKRAWQKTDVNRCTSSAASLFFFCLFLFFFLGGVGGAQFTQTAQISSVSS